ncbi:MAG: hypothetical protein WDN00_19045 [Limisphaerales bacterium]
MKINIRQSAKIYLSIALASAALNFSRAEDELVINTTLNLPGQVKPIPVSLEGFTGEASEVLRFDLYVQGFKIVSPDQAQYKISGSSSGNRAGRGDRCGQQTDEVFP